MLEENPMKTIIAVPATVLTVLLMLPVGSNAQTPPLCGAKPAAARAGIWPVAFAMKTGTPLSRSPPRHFFIHRRVLPRWLLPAIVARHSIQHQLLPAFVILKRRQRPINRIRSEEHTSEL